MKTNSKIAIARAHTNIAVVKYWGKANEKLILPQSSSLSLTLNRFYTDTAVQFRPELKHDAISINQKRIDHNPRIVSFLNLIRKRAGIHAFAKVDSVNHVPTAAGLASSASGLAALAAAASKAAGMQLSRQNLSRLARRGSGSATRSIFGGWVEWQKGTNDRNSYAYPVPHAKLHNIQVIALIVQRHRKKISSRKGMRRSVQTSPYYSAWKKVTAEDLKRARLAIQTDNFSTLGQVAETNAMRMHALTLSANPPFTYFQGETIRAIQAVQYLRMHNVECYYTIDAGPNVKILCQQKDEPKIQAFLSKRFGARNVVASGTGPGVKFLRKLVK